MSTRLMDGLYAVVEPRFVAGFVVEGGRVTMCAPILRRRLAYWMTRARRVDEGLCGERSDRRRGPQDRR